MKFEQIQSLCRRISASPWQQRVLHEELANPWHTGTPNEEGRYLAVIGSPLDEPFYVIATLRKEPNRMVWQGNIEPLAWQKIEPYKEKEEK